MSNPENPMDSAGPAAAAPVSRTTFAIAGIAATVHGLAELPPDAREVACLWLLHPRLATEAAMHALATQAVRGWYARRPAGGKGLIACSFDQRNHGGRLVDNLANESWRKGNPRHAQDMFSVYQGTAQDAALLITHLPSYLPASVPAPSAHLVLGVSLGGHAAWHALAADARVSAGVVVIGCPDFARLMAHRASKSRLPEWGDGAGERFFGSAAFPDALVAALEGADPAARLLPLAARATSLPPLKAPSDGALVPPVMRGVAARMNRAFGGKAILNLAGGKDKLVPYANSEPFLKFLKRAVDPEDGWWREGGLHFEDRVFAGAGHELTPEMAVEAVRFIGDVLEGKIKTQADGGLKSKM